MTAQEIAEQLKAQFLQGKGTVTQLPGRASAETSKFYNYHKGYDIGTQKGTPIIAPSDMEILGSGQQGGYGNRLVAYDPAKNETYYFSHLSDISPLNGTIKAGTTLGLTGGRPGDYGAGNTTGEHIDIETMMGRQSPNFSGALISGLQNRQVNNNNYDTQTLLKNARAKYGQGLMGYTNDKAKIAEYEKKGYKIQKITL